MRAERAIRATGWSLTSVADRIVPMLEATISTPMVPRSVLSRRRW